MDAASVIVALPLDPRFTGDLAALSLADLEAWIARPPAAPSTIGRRAATFRPAYRVDRRAYTFARPGATAGGPQAPRSLRRAQREVGRPAGQAAAGRGLGGGATAGLPRPGPHDRRHRRVGYAGPAARRQLPPHGRLSGQ